MEGEVVQGQRLAPSSEALRNELAERGWLPETVRPVHSFGRWVSRRGVSGEVVLLFTHELSALLEAGLTVPEALATASDREDAPRLSAVLNRVLEAVRRGERLSDACARYPEAFDEVFVSALRTGERSGDLVTSLRRFQQDLSRRLAVHKKVAQALAYPLFLLITLGVILALLFAFVLPRFVALYADFQAQLPLSTRILATFVERLPVLLPVALAIAVPASILARAWLRSEAGRLRWGAIKERLPFYGPLHRAYLVAHLARTLSTLLGAGLPMPDALLTAGAALPNLAFARRLERVRDRVNEGQSLGRSVREERLLPGTGIKLVEAGEASGRLVDMLAEIARYYEEVLEHALARSMALVEPALMLVMGILVGGIIIVMYLPIFQLADILR